MKLSVSGISFRYNSHPVLKGVSFDLPGGCVLGVLGRNGAGKSTLLKCLNRILCPKAGTVYLADNDILNLDRRQVARYFGYVPQTSDYSTLTVFDAVLLGRKPYIQWAPASGDFQRVEEILNTLELKHLALRPVHQLSGGELQKVTIARALAQDPKVLLMDEPTSNLDFKNQLEIVNLLSHAVRQQGLSAVVSVHDINLAFRFADYFLFLDQGAVYACLPRAEVTCEMIKAVYDVNVLMRHIAGHTVIIPMESDKETLHAKT